MKCVLLFSGGIDSAVLLAHLLARGDEVIAVSFDYGQTHRRELRAAKDLTTLYGVEHRVITLAGVFGRSALTGDAPIPVGHADAPDATEVPGRNLVMLSIGAAVAAAEGAAVVMFGANADDFGGYPDCRHSFITALDEAALLGTGYVSIAAPFHSLTKVQVLNLGRQLRVPLSKTWSCYRGSDEPCNNCGACKSRNEAMK